MPNDIIDILQGSLDHERNGRAIKKDGDSKLFAFHIVGCNTRYGRGSEHDARAYAKQLRANGEAVTWHETFAAPVGVFRITDVLLSEYAR